MDYLVGLEADSGSNELRQDIVQTLGSLSPQALEQVRDFVHFLSAKIRAEVQ